MSSKSVQLTQNKRKSTPKTKKSSRVGGKQSVTHRELTGYKYSPSNEIPESTPKPWYPLTVSKTGPPGEVTIAQLVGYTIDQLDKNFKLFRPYSSQTGKGAEIELRFRKIEVWNLTGRSLSISVWEPPAADYSTTSPGYTYNQLGGWTDAGGADTFPRIGYVYPLHIQGYVHKADWTAAGNDFDICTTTAGNASDTLLIRYHIWWRAPGPVTYQVLLPHPPAVRSLLSRISDIPKVNTALHSETKESLTGFESVVAKQITELKSVTSTLLQSIQTVCVAINNSMPHTDLEETIKTLKEFDICEDAEDQL